MDDLMGLSGREFLDALASGAPTPGGGSAAALSGAMGCALGEMVCALSIGRGKYAAFEPALRAAAAALLELRTELAAAVDADAAAYGAVMAAYRLPKEDAGARRAAIQAALAAAARSPLGALRRIAAAAEAVAVLPGRSNANAASDLGTACALLRAAADGALLNVLINADGIEDGQIAGEIRREAELAHGRAAALCDRVRADIRGGIG